DLTHAPFGASDLRCGWEARGIRAAVAVPLDGGRQSSLCLLVAQDRPRRWTAAEIALIEEIAVRVEAAVKWAGAEKALRRFDDTVKARLVSERDSLRQLFSHSPDFVAVLRGPRHVFEMANQSYRQLVGGRDLIGRPFEEALPELWEQGYPALLDQVFASREAFVGREMRALFRRPESGVPVPAYLDFVLQPMLDAEGAVSGIFMQGYEVTAHKQARDETRIAHERWKLAIESTGDGVWDWNVRSNEMVYSCRFKEILGYAENEFPDSYEAWKNCIHPEDQEQTVSRVHACLAGKAPAFRAEYRILCRDGDWKWVESHGIVVTRDGAGGAIRATGTLTDISAKKQTEAQYWSHANFDTLTGLPNRRLFRDRLDECVKKAARSGLGLALFFIDLDRFKEANDLLGHDAGDLLLVEAGKRIAGSVRIADTVARLGGDEFTVILDGQDEEAHVERTAQKIIDALAQPFHIGNEIVYLSASVGITLYSKDANASEELIRNADQAMYAAKNAGRNRFSYFTRAMQEEADHRFRLGGDLRQALDEGRLDVHYQPVIDLASGRIVKAEALVRWHHPRLGMIEPAQFIPIAEETGQIKKLGNWVFRQVAASSKRWSVEFGATFPISINKSPMQFMTWDEDGGWIDHLRALGLPGHSLVIEITEGLLLNPSPVVTEKLARYRAAGVELALDDFGTGYSSMAYLRKFDIDYLKIDQSFIGGITEDDEDWAITESIIVMARRLGLKVIAEGIESQRQKEMLAAVGCNLGQGFLFSPALPAAEFEQRLRAERMRAGEPAETGDSAA
ncbi:MAG: EAL domain-containing protein, partial [Burkholderiaceae bacterium]